MTPADQWQDPIYDVTFALVCCPFEELVPLLKKEWGIELDLADGAEATTISHCSPRNGCLQIFWFPSLPRTSTPIRAIGLIAHEALHAVGSVMRAKDIPFTHSSDEAWTYYLAWVCQELTSRLAGKKKWKKLLPRAPK